MLEGTGLDKTAEVSASPMGLDDLNGDFFPLAQATYLPCLLLRLHLTLPLNPTPHAAPFLLLLISSSTRSNAFRVSCCCSTLSPYQKSLSSFRTQRFRIDFNAGDDDAG